MPFVQVEYFSESLQMQSSAWVILPDRSFEAPYYPLLQLHGLSDNHTGWMRWTRIEQHVRHLPIMVVMPDGGRSFYCDAVDGPAYGKAIGEELPEVISHYFKVRDEWAVGGLSMGGYGAVRLALTYPDRFRSASSHSGALKFGHGPADLDDPFGREFAPVVGPDPTGGPADLFALAEKADHFPSLYIDCGTEDYLLEPNRDFHAHLDAVGCEHIYREHPGDHNWFYWDQHLPAAIAHHVKSLGIPAS